MEVKKPMYEEPEIFHYTNTIGRRKILEAKKQVDSDMIDFSIFDEETGEFCGSGLFNERQLKNFLGFYNEGGTDEAATS